MLTAEHIAQALAGERRPQRTGAGWLTYCYESKTDTYRYVGQSIGMPKYLDKFTYLKIKDEKTGKYKSFTTNGKIIVSPMRLP